MPLNFHQIYFQKEAKTTCLIAILTTSRNYYVTCRNDFSFKNVQFLDIEKMTARPLLNLAIF